MFTTEQVDELIDLLVTLTDKTKIYLGCDSVRFIKDGKKFAKFATVLIVHKNGKNGCRVFSNTSVEPDYDVKADRPSMRLMTEVMKICELYTQLAPILDDYQVEIHLDIGTDLKKNASSCVAAQAAGYVLGVTGIEPKLKPDSWAASHGADGVAHGRG
jgi:predicted RNase H-related nuclease YkuK (DUF458 family)